jgi:hypothetical protein
MDGFDSTTWQALGLVLTLLGLGLSALVWARRGPAKGLRGVAWSLLPLAAGLTGVLRLGWEVSDAVLDWAAGLAFSPVVWLGLVVAGVSAVLFVVSGWMMRRRGERPGALPRSQAAAPAEVAAPGKGLPHASLPTGGAQRAGASRTGSAGDDMTDVEEILRKHGIQ